MITSVFIDRCVQPGCEVDVAAVAFQSLQWALLAAVHRYQLSRDFVSQVCAPIQPYLKLVSLIWTISILLNAIIRTLFVTSKQLTLPGTTNQKRRVKFAVPIAWGVKVHFVFKPKKQGYTMKLGASIGDVKVLVVLERSKDAALVIKRQIKCYGSLSLMKFSTTVDQ